MENPVPSRWVYSLVKEMSLAAKLAEAASEHGVGIRNFDRSERLLSQSLEQAPFLVIADLDKNEAESFRLLKAFRSNADLRGVPVIGCVTQAKREIKAEAEFAGCLRVYFKTEFMKSLSDIIVRYAK